MHAKNSIFSGIRRHLEGGWKPQPWLAPLSPIYWALACLHRFLHQVLHHVQKAASAADSREPPAIPLVVIGALKAGGSGKTSVTLELARAFRERGLEVAILAYRMGKGPGDVPASTGAAGSSGPEILLEVLEGNDWRQSSEEALMLRQASGARVFVTRDRSRAWKSLQTLGRNGESHFDLILSDDGYQDTRLIGTFRLLLLEEGSDPGIFDLLPAGNYRETGNARGRAQLILQGPHPDISDVVRTGPVPTHESAMPDETGPIPVLRFWRKLLLPAGLDRTRPWIVFCGLGDNGPFLKDLEREGILPVAVLEGRNHAAMSAERIAAAALRHPDAGFLCTRKDFIKLDGDLLSRFYILAVDQSIRLDPGIAIAVEAYCARYSRR